MSILTPPMLRWSVPAIGASNGSLGRGRRARGAGVFFLRRRFFMAWSSGESWSGCVDRRIEAGVRDWLSGYFAAVGGGGGGRLGIHTHRYATVTPSPVSTYLPWGYTTSFLTRGGNA